jgi:hypothetical protein
MLRPVRRPRTASPAAAAVAALSALTALTALAGCGSGGPTDEQLVVRAVTGFGRATAAKDYGALCDRILAPSLISQVTAIGLPCERALQRGLGSVRSPILAVGAVTVDGDRATAEVQTAALNQSPSRDTLQLQRVHGAWRVASLAR